MWSARWAYAALGVALLTACGDDEVAPADTVELDAAEVDGGAPDATETIDDRDATDVSATADDADAETTATATDGEVVGDDADGDGGEVLVEPDSSGFPAAGLLVRIADPGANGLAEVTGASTRVAGLLFGDADTLLWQSGAQSGVIEPGPFWQSGQIILAPGDNTITVTAVAGATSVSDTLVVTYNPGFRFDDALVARPSVWWTGEPTEAVFTVPASLYRNIDTSTVRLVRVDAQGDLIEELGALRDDGALSSSGDEIELDGVFSWTGAFTCTTPGPMFFRATVRVNASPSYTAVSSMLRVECLARTSGAACESHQAIIDAAGLALEGGSDLASVAAQIGADPSVDAVGLAEDGAPAIWITFDDGLLGAVLAPTAGTRGGGPLGAAASSLVHALGGAATSARPVGSVRALVLSPFASELTTDDESPEVASLLEATSCPPYEVESGGALVDGDASIARLRTLSRYGIVALATHGAALFGDVAAELATRLGWSHAGPQEVLWTGSPVRCDALLAAPRECLVTSVDPDGDCPEGTRCLVTKGTASDTGATGEGVCFDDTQVDLLLGRALLTNRGLAVVPSFFTAWRGRGLPSSYVHLGACHSLWNGSLATALYAAGADAISGFSGTVSSPFARARALALFAQIGGPGTLGDFHELAVDPAYPETRSRLFGARDLALDQADLVNADFEAGSTQGWTSAGDGRVVAQFGDAAPVAGKFMGLVSSGLGYSVETGRLTQDFCIPEGRTTLTLWWRFYSEEFREWCGDAEFQDTFHATLEDAAGGSVPIVNVRIDDLCQYQDGTCGQCPNPVACDPECFAQTGCNLTDDGQACVGAYACQCGRYFEGLEASDIDFDRGGVYRTSWRKTTVDVSGLAGRGPITLTLEVEDSGDSAFDTAILIDKIEVE